MLMSCIDTCSSPLGCNNQTSGLDPYCSIRKCYLNQGLDDDSLLTVIFLDICLLKTEKNHCNNHIWAAGMTCCYARKFPCHWLGGTKLTILSSTQISAQLQS